MTRKTSWEIRNKSLIFVEKNKVIKTWFYFLSNSQGIILIDVQLGQLWVPWMTNDNPLLLVADRLQVSQLAVRRHQTWPIGGINFFLLLFYFYFPNWVLISVFCSTDGPVRIFHRGIIFFPIYLIFLPPYAPTGNRTHVSRVAPHGCFFDWATAGTSKVKAILSPAPQFLGLQFVTCYAGNEQS